MLFDPMDERTPEEIVTYLWHNTWGEDFKSGLLAAAEDQGCTWLELAMAGVNRVMEEMGHDADRYQEVMKHFRFASIPFGMDPRLTKDGE